MDSDKLEGNWEELKGKLQERWGRLTDDDMDVIDGKKSVLVGKLMEKYGMSEEAATKAIEHIV
ncbi:MAG: CsbD family protein [Atopostipes suicloacalis]|nr:CsbD family protein [Atopostipes suicloacalis]